MKYIILFFIFMFILLFSCRPAPSTIPAFNAQSQINAAADYKAKQCKQEVPTPPLYVFEDQDKRNVDLCSIAITRMSCPFDAYPIICIGIYLDNPIPEIPWYLNFNELTKQRFKF
ncbi:MAG: hypothetical protein H7A25_21260 [Leptospiraceae bacterium]|nr:hypothetical protein [Leptospiraceae bacterium]MCP5502440.1 hypothetical protein [Leptospiraceae bacterium]